jgi:anti-anti-sigma regulatory factor
MTIHVRFEGEVAILGGIASLMNDPRHFDALRDVGDLLDRGILRFVLEMDHVRETGPTILGLLTTLTRKIRQADGEAVLSNLTRPMERFLVEMRMDDDWDVFDDAAEAIAFLARRRVGTNIYE